MLMRFEEWVRSVILEDQEDVIIWDRLFCINRKPLGEFLNNEVEI